MRNPCLRLTIGQTHSYERTHGLIRYMLSNRHVMVDVYNLTYSVLRIMSISFFHSPKSGLNKRRALVIGQITKEELIKSGFSRVSFTPRLHVHEGRGGVFRKIILDIN